MAVRQVSPSEATKDNRRWVYELRYQGKKIKSKKFSTRREALAAERNFYQEKEKTGNQSLMTLRDLFKAHYNYQKDKVKSTTLYNYRKRISHYESLMDIKLDVLNINDIERWKQEINSHNYKINTKNDLMKYLKSALNFGTKFYDFNFTSLYHKIANFSNPNEVPKEMDFYTYEEFLKFISVEEDIKFRTLFETLYFCGLRRAEIRGLTWTNIDFEKKELRITQNVVNISGDGGKWLVTTPKTRTSKRQIPIPDVLLDDLKKLKEESKKYYGFKDKWFVFGSFEPIHPDAIRVRKNENAKKAGVKQIRTHDFRHSCASLLINKGADVTLVAKYLGHAKIEETLNTYSHVFQTKLDDIVNKINDLSKKI